MFRTNSPSSSSAPGPLTLGLLVSRLERGFHRSAFQRVERAAEEYGVSLVSLDGGVLNFPEGFEAQGNIIYQLATPALVDGLIIWSSALDWSLQAREMEAFCAGFEPLPVISVGRELEGIPSILVDNYQGMGAAVHHLIKEHGYRKIAFLRGPEGNHEEEQRYRAYVDGLAEAGLPLERRLVSAYTNWERSDGLEAVRLLLDERGLRPGEDFEALLSVGDDMACGAIEALRARGVRVPEDVAVVGFNDDEEGRAISPSLTTVRQPVEALGRLALERLLRMLNGEAAPERLVLPLELIIRRSCGCLSPQVLQASAGSLPHAEKQERLREVILRDTAAALEAAGGKAEPGWLESLLDSFESELRGAPPPAGKSGPFLLTLTRVLRQAVHQYGDIGAWQGAISSFRRGLLPTLQAPEQRSRAEDLWQAARVLVGEIAVQERAYEKFQGELYARLLSEAGRVFGTASGWEDLMEKLASQLPRLGIQSGSIVMYEDPQAPLERARLALAFTPQGRVEPEETRRVYPTRQLLPEGLSPAQGRRSLVVLPLYFRERQLGFAVLDARGPDASVYETLREGISSALESVLLREEIELARQQAEAANQLKSRFLATVSHELRTPLSLIVGTIEMMLGGEQAASPLPEIYRQDMRYIHASAQHLFRLIGDVLDLASSHAGELRLVCEPLDLARVLGEAALLGESLAREKGLEWKVDIPPCLPPVLADRTRLRQVVLNLISNAVKFTEQGQVALIVAEAGQWVRVEVRDTGMGIPSGEQEAIFDEFGRSERSVSRGYGGMGLGLAITRRLIELHGGQVSVRSSGEEGEGSTFVFTLPVLNQPGGAAEAPAPASNTVLLLAEDLAPAGRLQEHLQARGFQVSALEVGRTPDWLARVVAEPPAAVLLDYQPAAERGWELMRALKDNPATREIPVLFYALAAGEERGSVLELNYLPKPMGEPDLSALLESLGWKARDEGRSILVVDDDPGILDMHVRLLECRLPDCRILVARDGLDALQVMEQERPDLVLLDLMMPGLDGFGVLEAMREREATRRIPVIILTAQTLTGPDIERLQRGVAAVLGKGLFTSGEVLAQVEAALNRSKRLGSEAQRIVRQAMAYMHENYASPITRAGLAGRLAVSERYLTRCFHQEMGITPITYLNRYRIHRAKALLEQGHTNLTEVALAVGFSDSNYFGRVFREEVGTSPGAFLRGRPV